MIKGIKTFTAKPLELEDLHEVKIHELKIIPHYFEKVLSGEKTFELRKNDRDFQVDDVLILKEWAHELIWKNDFGEEQWGNPHYTGKEIKKKVTYIYHGGPNGLGLRTGFCILALGDYKEMGSITDKEIEAFGKFSDYEKRIIKEQYSKYPEGTFPNPICALH
jgi:hypothetical protein